MSYREHRERTIARLMAAGWNYYDADRLHARANTAQRLAEAMCNGDYPADNGERKTRECPRCGCGWAPAAFVTSAQLATWKAERKQLQADPETGPVMARAGAPYSPEKIARLQELNALIANPKICPDCRNDEKIGALLPEGWTFTTAGDPRGCVLRVAPPGVNVRAVNGDEARQVICVESRS